MRDIDQILDAQVSEAATRAARHGDFDALAARGHRRRRRVRAASVIGVAAAALAVVGVMNGAAEPPPSSPEPATQEHTPLEDRDQLRGLSSADVAAHPDARLVDVAVGDDPDLRAAAWNLCVAGGCRQVSRTVLAVTEDGFDSASYTPVGTRFGGPEITPVASVGFVLSDSRHSVLVRPDGSQLPVDVAGPAAATGAGDVVVPSDETWWRPNLVVDPVTGRAHELAGPPDIRDLRNSSGLLHGWRAVPTPGTRGGLSVRLVWSTDAGNTWRQHRPFEAHRRLYESVPTGDPSTMAGVDRGSLPTDGEGMELGRIERSTDGGVTWEAVTVASGPRPLTRWHVIRPDGSLLVWVSRWSDQDVVDEPSRPLGLYESEGDDWSTLTPLPSTLDDAAGTGRAVHFEQQYVADEVHSLYVRIGSELHLSTDSGSTWEPVRLR